MKNVKLMAAVCVAACASFTALTGYAADTGVINNYSCASIPAIYGARNNINNVCSMISEQGSFGMTTNEKTIKMYNVVGKNIVFAGSDNNNSMTAPEGKTLVRGDDLHFIAPPLLAQYKSYAQELNAANVKAEQRLDEGQVQDIEFYYAFDNTKVRAGIVPYYYVTKADGTDATANGGWDFQIGGTGDITAFGSKAYASIITNKWYKFNIQVSANAENINNMDYKVFIDNTLVCSGTKNFDCKQFRGIRLGRFFRVWAEGSDKTTVPVEYPVNKTYFSGIKCSVYNSGDEKLSYDKVTISHSDPVIDANMNSASWLSSYVDAATTEKEYMDGLSVEGAKTVQLVNADGTVVEEPGNSSVVGKYVRIITANDQRLFMTPSAGIIAESFSAADSKITPWAFNKKTDTAGEYVDGLAGRETDDKSFAITTTNTTGEAVTDPFIKTEWARAYSGTPITVSTSVYFGKNNSGAIKFLTDNYGYDDGAMKNREQAVIVMIDPNGYVYAGNGTYRAAKVNAEEWNKIAITIYPNTKCIDLYVNNKLVCEKAEVVKNNFYFLGSMKWENSYFGKGKSGFAAFDDFALYAGKFNAAAVTAALSSDDEGTTVYNLTGKIYTDVSNKEEFEAYTNAGEFNPRYFTDHSCAGETEEIADGTVIVVSKDGAYKYYTVSSGAAPAVETDGVFALTLDGKAQQSGFGKGNLNAELSFDAKSSANVRLFLAQYDSSNRLIDAKFADAVIDSDNNSISCSYNVENADNTTMKAFIWESGKLVPISGRTVIAKK